MSAYIDLDDQHVSVAKTELAILHEIVAAALRVASSRRNGIVTDRAVLDELDKALEERS